MKKPKKSLEANIRTVTAGDEIRLPKLSHVVADRLRSQIVQGQLAVGDRLPSEVELLEIYKISRPTLREALRILESESLIAVSRGIRSGATVLGPTVERAAEYAAVILATSGTTLSDVHSARTFLEPSIVRALASGKNAEATKTLSDCVDRLAANLESENYPAVVSSVSEFHELLVRFCGSQTLILLVGMLRFILGGSYAGILTGSNSTDLTVFHRGIEKTIKSYRTLIAMIADKKADEAQTFWRTYMESGHDFLNRTGLGKKRIAHRGGVST